MAGDEIERLRAELEQDRADFRFLMQRTVNDDTSQSGTPERVRLQERTNRITEALIRLDDVLGVEVGDGR